MIWGTYYHKFGQNIKIFKILCTKYMASSEVMTSSTHSFAYSYRLVKKCFVKICETCHNFLIFQPIFIRFLLLCLEIFTLSSEIKLNLLWSSSLMLAKLRGPSYLRVYKLNPLTPWWIWHHVLQTKHFASNFIFGICTLDNCLSGDVTFVFFSIWALNYSNILIKGVHLCSIFSFTRKQRIHWER